jgi:hypothetical protein
MKMSGLSPSVQAGEHIVAILFWLPQAPCSMSTSLIDGPSAKVYPDAGVKLIRARGGDSKLASRLITSVYPSFTKDEVTRTLAMALTLPDNGCAS